MKRTFICELCGKPVSGEIPNSLKINGNVSISCGKCTPGWTCGTARMMMGVSERQRKIEAEQAKRKELRKIYNMSGIQVNDIRENIHYVEFAMSLKPEDDVRFVIYKESAWLGREYETTFCKPKFRKIRKDEE